MICRAGWKSKRSCRRAVAMYGALGAGLLDIIGSFRAE